MSTSQESDVAPTTGKLAPARQPAHLRANLRAFWTLAAILVCGWALTTLGDRLSPRPAFVDERRDRAGNTLFFVAESRDPRLLRYAPPRTIHCREPASFDPQRSLVSFADGAKRVVPPGAAVVLIHAARGIEVLPALEPAVVVALMRAPAETPSFPRWFAAHGALDRAPAKLKDFWRAAANSSSEPAAAGDDRSR